MKKCLFLLLVVMFLTATGSFGQRLKYSDIKDDYTTSNYCKVIDHQHYSPFLAGALNFVFPALGYYYVDETVRGLMMSGGELLAITVAIYGLTRVLSTELNSEFANHNARAIMITGTIAANVLYLWSIIDVVRISKVKNMALQDKKQSLTLRVNPNFGIASMSNRCSPFVGARLSIAF